MKKGDLRDFRHYPMGEHHIFVQAEVKLSRGVLPVSYEIAKDQEFDHEAALDKHKEVGEHWIKRLDKLGEISRKQTRKVQDDDHSIEIVDCTIAYGCLNDWELIVQFMHDGKLHSIRQRYDHPNVIPSNDQILAMIDDIIGVKVEKQAMTDVHRNNLEKLRDFVDEK